MDNSHTLIREASSTEEELAQEELAEEGLVSRARCFILHAMKMPLRMSGFGTFLIQGQEALP